MVSLSVSALLPFTPVFVGGELHVVFRLLKFLEASFANISVVSWGIRVLRGKLQVAEK